MAKALSSFLFNEAGFTEVIAYVVPNRHASKRVVEKLGFQNRGLVERQGFKEDVYLYVLTKPVCF